MGSSKLADQPTLSVPLTVELHAKLKVAADERGMSMRLLAARLIDESLPKLLPADEFRLTRPRQEPT